MHARETITEVIEKIKTSNKHIKIADGSDGGWETVRQYQSSPVASESDDESKINKAGNSALRKRNLMGNKAAVKPNNGGQHTSFQLKINPFVSLKHGTMGLPCTMDNPYGYQHQIQQQGECYGCGSFQHWRSKYPFNPRPAMPKPK